MKEIDHALMVDEVWVVVIEKWALVYSEICKRAQGHIENN